MESRKPREWENDEEICVDRVTVSDSDEGSITSEEDHQHAPDVEQAHMVLR